jgi:hypothetical protein
MNFFKSIRTRKKCTLEKDCNKEERKHEYAINISIFIRKINGDPIFTSLAILGGSIIMRLCGL